MVCRFSRKIVHGALEYCNVDIIRKKGTGRRLQANYSFCDYSRVWKYDISPEYGRGLSVDIYARSRFPVDYSIIGEVKSREEKKFFKGTRKVTDEIFFSG